MSNGFDESRQQLVGTVKRIEKRVVTRRVRFALGVAIARQMGADGQERQVEWRAVPVQRRPVFDGLIEQVRIRQAPGAGALVQSLLTPVADAQCQVVAVGLQQTTLAGEIQARAAQVAAIQRVEQRRRELERKADEAGKKLEKRLEDEARELLE